MPQSPSCGTVFSVEGLVLATQPATRTTATVRSNSESLRDRTNAFMGNGHYSMSIAPGIRHSPGQLRDGLLELQHQRHVTVDLELTPGPGVEAVQFAPLYSCPIGRRCRERAVRVLYDTLVAGGHALLAHRVPVTAASAGQVELHRH